MTITDDSFASLIHCQPRSQFKLAQDVPCTECPEVLRETFRTNKEWEGDKVPQTLMRAGDAEESDHSTREGGVAESTGGFSLGSATVLEVSQHTCLQIIHIPWCFGFLPK